MTPLALLAYLANHDDIRPQVAPGLAHVDVGEHDVPGLQVFGDETGAVMFSPVPEDPGVYEMHYLFTRSVRGRAALNRIRAAITLMFTEHHATAICGAVPREHRASRVMSRALGARPIGSHTDYFGRACILYVIERASWVVLSAESLGASAP
jgi:hypothetical protein